MAMDATETAVSDFLDDRSGAIWAKDLDRLMAFYSSDIVYFDIVPPLQYVGSDALRGRFSHWFSSYQSPIGQEINELTISASGDIAITSMLIRASGTLVTGREVELWVRATSGCRRTQTGWLITHEHVSLPVDLEQRRPVTDIAP